MTDQEHEEDKKKKDQSLMYIALQQAKTGQRFFYGSDIKKKIESKSDNRVIIKRPLTQIITEIPSLDELAELDPDTDWSGRDLLYEVSLVSLVEFITKIMKNQRVPQELISSLEGLIDAMRDGDGKETLHKLHYITEKWGAISGSSDTHYFHLLRSIIRIIYATYPLQTE